MENLILAAQKSEITEHFVYQMLSQSGRNPHNQSVLKQISDDELKHYDFWKKYTRQDVKPNRLSLWKYYLISRIFGITFGIKLMEKVETKAQAIYEEISNYVPEVIDIQKDEKEHERKPIDLIDEERLRYVRSMVLGLNDALVELTGALAGFTLAFRNTRLIAMAGFITGIAASLSMATSEYLSTKSEESSRDPLKASAYTGSAYVSNSRLDLPERSVSSRISGSIRINRLTSIRWERSGRSLTFISKRLIFASLGCDPQVVFWKLTSLTTSAGVNPMLRLMSPLKVNSRPVSSLTARVISGFKLL